LQETRKSVSVYMFGLIALFAVVGIAGSVSAVTVSEVPEALADTMGIDEYSARVLLSMSFIMGVTLALAFARAPFFAYVAVDLVMIIFFVSIAWLDYWIIILIIVVLMLVFGTQMRDTLFPGGGGGE
jgi:hypothetical protein